MFKLTLRTVVLLAPLALWAGSPGAAELPAQSSVEAGVTLKAAPRSLAGAQWEFELVFDTHVQALEDDPLSGAVLIAADGSAVAPVAWQGDPPCGHHLTGVLRFKAL